MLVLMEASVEPNPTSRAYWGFFRIYQGPFEKDARSPLDGAIVTSLWLRLIWTRTPFGSQR